MLRFLRGKSREILEPIVGVLTDDPSSITHRSIYFCKSHTPNIIFQNRPLAILTQDSFQDDLQYPQLAQINYFERLKNDDIVVIHPDGTLNILFDSSSQHNGLLVTEMCNSNCLMCSQPPKSRNDIEYLYKINASCVELIPIDCKYLGITGGEPTLLDAKLFNLMALLATKLPSTEIQILTNGRKFSDLDYAKNISNYISSKFIFCIPLYADYYSLHDYVVQSKGAFFETLSGLHNLARYGVRIEIRIVVHKITYTRLFNTAEFIFKNFPFVEHVAFMGLENEGYTPHNIDQLWINPNWVLDQLNDAVIFLDNRGIQVSIYNLQHCILPISLWKFARQSISDWKNLFLDECSKCDVKSSCAGLFASSLELYKPYIKAITHN